MLRGFGASQGVQGWSGGLTAFLRAGQHLNEYKFHVLSCGVAVVPEAWHPRASSCGQAALAALPETEDGACY